jgi:hypothetical protein
MNMSVVYQYQEPSQNYTGDDHTKKKLIFLVALIVGVLLVIVLVAVLATSKNVKNTNSTETPNITTANTFVSAVYNKDSSAISETSTFSTNLTDDEIIENGDPLEDLRVQFNLSKCSDPAEPEADRVTLVCEKTAQPLEESTTKFKGDLTLLFNDQGKIFDTQYESQSGEAQ